MLDRLRDLVSEYAGPGESLIGVVVPRVIRLLHGAETLAEFHKAQRDTAWKDKGQYFSSLMQSDRRLDDAFDEIAKLKDALALFTQRQLPAGSEEASAIESARKVADIMDARVQALQATVGDLTEQLGRADEVNEQLHARVAGLTTERDALAAQVAAQSQVLADIRDIVQTTAITEAPEVLALIDGLADIPAAAAALLAERDALQGEVDRLHGALLDARSTILTASEQEMHGNCLEDLMSEISNWTSEERQAAETWIDDCMRKALSAGEASDA
jgi:chromosome segregation ATPase